MGRAVFLERQPDVLMDFQVFILLYGLKLCFGLRAFTREEIYFINM